MKWNRSLIDSRKKIIEITNEIRKLAADDDISIDKHIHKNEPWKDALVNMVSDDFVINQLVCLQPYCWAGKLPGEDLKGEYCYVLPYFYFPIYVYIDLDHKRVTSFHYSVSKGETNLDTVPRILSYESGDEDDTDRMVDIILDPVKGHFLTFASGVKKVTFGDVLVESSYFGTDVITVRELQEYITEVKYRTIANLSRNITNRMNTPKGFPVVRPDTAINILSYAGEERLLQMVSFCTDVFNSDPYQFSWIKEYLNAVVLSVDPKILKKYESQIPWDIANYIKISDYLNDSEKSLPNTTNEFGGLIE